MNSLGNELQTLLEKTGLRQMDIHRKTGMQVSTLSRIFSGSTKHPEDKDLDRIIEFLTGKDKQAQAKLVRARMRGAYNGRYRDLVKITLVGGGSKPDRLALSEISVDPEIKRAFEFLYNLVPEKPAVGKSILQLAWMLGHDDKS